MMCPRRWVRLKSGLSVLPPPLALSPLLAVRLLAIKLWDCRLNASLYKCCFFIFHWIKHISLRVFVWNGSPIRCVTLKTLKMNFLMKQNSYSLLRCPHRAIEHHWWQSPFSCSRRQQFTAQLSLRSIRQHWLQYALKCDGHSRCPPQSIAFYSQKRWNCLKGATIASVTLELYRQSVSFSFTWPY